MNFDRPHRRYNALTGEWVLVSPHRARRPWLGQVEKPAVESLPAYDPTCYLCPGNERSGGIRNPVYDKTFVFDNDFSALLPPDAGVPAAAQEHPLFQAQAEAGVCRVICFSPRHDLSIPGLPLEGVEDVVRTWTDQTRALGELEFIQYVQVFENKGAMMGASNPHPHSQIWASQHVPNEPAKELRQQAAYLHEHGTCLLCDYLKAEQANGERIVAANDGFTALVPFWAIWPFEIILVSHQHEAGLTDLDARQVTALADILQQVTRRYDALFEVSFPYSMGFHQAPVKGGPFPGWHLHAHFYPPLLRSATVRKFMVGYELLSNPQRDLTPEQAADRLRSVSL